MSRPRRSPWHPMPAEVIIVLMGTAPITLACAVIWSTSQHAGFAPVLTIGMLALTVKLLMDAAYIAGMRRETDARQARQARHDTGETRRVR